MKISDKLFKVDESLSIHMYDNGYMIEVGGRDDEDNWASAKILCDSLEKIFEYITEASKIKRT